MLVLLLVGLARPRPIAPPRVRRQAPLPLDAARPPPKVGATLPPRISAVLNAAQRAQELIRVGAEKRVGKTMGGAPSGGGGE